MASLLPAVAPPHTTTHRSSWCVVSGICFPNRSHTTHHHTPIKLGPIRPLYCTSHQCGRVRHDGGNSRHLCSDTPPGCWGVGRSETGVDQADGSGIPTAWRVWREKGWVRGGGGDLRLALEGCGEGDELRLCPNVLHQAGVGVADAPLPVQCLRSRPRPVATTVAAITADAAVTTVAAITASTVVGCHHPETLPKHHLA